MLDGHPELACPGETDFIFDSLVLREGKATCDATKLERSRIYRAHAARYRDRPVAELTPDAFINRIAGQDQIAVLMLHRNADRVVDLYPGVKFIHLVRDPRDVARSSIGMGWAGNVYHGVDHWIATETTWHAAARNLAQDQVLEVRYESLILAPEDTLKRVCEFCDVPFDPRMLTYAESSTYDRPDPSLVMQWTTKLTAREVALVEYKVGGLLSEVGYRSSGLPLEAPALLERLLLDLQNRRAIWSRRVQRYGLRDSATVALTRRFGRQTWSDGARRRMDSVTVKYLK
jgi:hypothetical protein